MLRLEDGGFSLRPRGGGILLGRAELRRGHGVVRAEREEFLEPRLERAVVVREGGVLVLGDAEVQLSLAPRGSKLSLGGAALVERQPLLRRPRELLDVNLHLLLVLARLGFRR